MRWKHANYATISFFERNNVNNWGQSRISLKPKGVAIVCSALIYISNLENKDSSFSVGVLAYPDVLEKVAEILDDDLYFYAKNPSYIYIAAQNEKL